MHKPRGEKMKLLVFTSHFWLKRSRGIINTITQIRDKTAKATQGQLEFGS